LLDYESASQLISAGLNKALEDFFSFKIPLTAESYASVANSYSMVMLNFI
jgi:hypothetical protein